MFGNLEPIEAGGVDNYSPVVWVIKSDKLQMRAGYNVHLNNKNSTEAYFLPRIESIFSKVLGAKFVSKIDISNVHWQIPPDDKSQNVCTVYPNRGLF